MVEVLFLGTLVTKLVDTVRNAVDQEGKAPKVVWNLVAFGFGIGVALLGNANLVPGLGDAGEVITGIGFGAAGSGVHEFLDFLSSKAKGA